MASQEELKRAVAIAAVRHVQALIAPGSVIGVGTGSTADLFIDELVALRSSIAATVASSERSARRLRDRGFTVVDLNEVESLPVYVDGADEIDAQLAMIKGGGGALTREKIVAAVAREFLCIADESKLVPVLGRYPLPVEVIPMARAHVARVLRGIGGDPRLREGFTTDNGNEILDVHGLRIDRPIDLEEILNQVPGIVTVGLFATRGADLLLLAGASGVRELRPAGPFGERRAE